MPSFLFVTWEGGGNVNPLLGLAEGLLARGHRVRAVASVSLHDRMAAAGVEVVAEPSGWLPTADEVAADAAAGPVDVAVVDYMVTSGLNGARTLGLPVVALVHTLYLDLLLDGAPSPIGMAGDRAMLNAERARMGLPLIERMGDLLDELALVLVTAPRELDGPGELPSNVRYTGALFESPGPDAQWVPPVGDGPLVVASMGTAGHGETPVVQRVLDAVAGTPVRGLVTLPGYVDPCELSVPENVVVSGYVRHAAVMPHADLVVTHAGLGTVTAALAWGVPMVCIPEDREQPDNAAAVVRLGAGQVLGRDAAPARIRAAIEAGLAGPRPSPRPPDGQAVDLVEALAIQGAAEFGP